jgi:copper transport protein
MRPTTIRLPRPAHLWWVGALVLLFLAVLPARPAWAHASLKATDPADGQVLDDAPEEVSLTFNEPVTSAPGALRVYNKQGDRVDTGEQEQTGDDTVTVRLRPDIGSGSYVATFRVTSADGHVIRGAYVFSVQTVEPVSDDTLEAIFAGGSDTAINVVAGIARGIGYVGALLLGGAVAWRLAVGRQRRDEQVAARRWATRGAVMAAVAALVAIPAQAMLTSGLGLAALGSSGVLVETVGSSVGVGALARFGAAVLVLVFLPMGRSGTDLTVLATLGVLGSFLIDGHTRTVSPAALMYVADAAHILAAAAWFGGIVLLVTMLRRRRVDDDPVGAADVIARFSGLATWALVLVTVAGGAMAWALVRQPRALTSTDYGWTLIAKVVLVVVVILVGLYNNRRLVPVIVRTATPSGGSSELATDTDTDATATRRTAARRAAWGQLRRTATFEASALVLVIAVTAFLVNLRPAAEAAGITGAFDTIVAVSDDLTLNLVVDPNRAGPNEIHLYLLDRTGRPVSDVQDVRLLLSQPERDIGPIERDTFVAGPGHWQLNGSDLAIPGEWQIEAIIGVDRFTEERVVVTVVVNPA